MGGRCRAAGLPYPAGWAGAAASARPHRVISAAPTSRWTPKREVQRQIAGGASESPTADCGSTVLVVAPSPSPQAARPSAATTATGAAQRSARLPRCDTSCPPRHPTVWRSRWARPRTASR